LMHEQLPPAIALAVIAHEGTGARLFLSSAPEQRERLLPDIISAKRIACTGNTEPDVGSDPRSVKTRAVEDGDSLVINGRKMWITNASISDMINTTCSVGKDEKGLSKLMRVLVERDQSPFTAVEISMLGLRQGHLGEVLFDGCRVPKHNALGEPGDAARVLTLTWLANRPIFGLFAVHLAQRAFDAALQYAGERTQFGRKIGNFQLVQELLADISTAITTSRLLCYYALSCIDNGERANHVSAMAKRYALANCQRAISLAMEVHGAIGLSRELGLEQLYRDARMLTVPDGTNQILTLIEGRELTGVAAYR
jgi:alkylation response protein AidB-like acyl-CoA dehydrogenase